MTSSDQTQKGGEGGEWRRTCCICLEELLLPQAEGPKEQQERQEEGRQATEEEEEEKLERMARTAHRLGCQDMFCRGCLEAYLTHEVLEGRVPLSCPIPSCSLPLSPAELQELLPLPLYERALRYSLKRGLHQLPGIHFCPGVDCEYAVVVEKEARGWRKPRGGGDKAAKGVEKGAGLEEHQRKGKKGLKSLLGDLLRPSCEGSALAHKCPVPSCQTKFCLACDGVWHAPLTCEENRMMSRRLEGTQMSSDDVKPCPKCSVPIYKLQDGSCNQIKCSFCKAEFCWLCLKEVSALHYLGPSGCTFHAKKAWGWKKKLAGQVAFVVTAPALIALMAGVALPGIMLTFPISVNSTISQKYRDQPVKKKLLRYSAVPLATITSPVVATGVVAIGVPVLLVGAYVAVPIYMVAEALKNKELPGLRSRRATAFLEALQ